MTVDLETCTVSDEHGFSASFDMDEFRRFCMQNGLDDIGLTMQDEGAITAFEAQQA